MHWNGPSLSDDDFFRATGHRHLPNGGRFGHLPALATVKIRCAAWRIASHQANPLVIQPFPQAAQHSDCLIGIAVVCSTTISRRAGSCTSIICDGKPVRKSPSTPFATPNRPITLCGSLVPAPYTELSMRENRYSRLIPPHTGITADNTFTKIEPSLSLCGS